VTKGVFPDGMRIDAGKKHIEYCLWSGLQ